MECLGFFKKSQAGFSLIEAMTVTFVLGIMAAVAVPAVTHLMPNYRLKKAAKDLYVSFQKTKIQAIRTNQACAVVFNINTNTYRILSDPGPDAVWGTGDDEDDHPGPDGIHGTADDIPEKPAVSLADYGSGVRFVDVNDPALNPDVNDEAPGDLGGVIPADGVSYVNNRVTLNPRGLVDGQGYVYLQNNDGAVFAVGTPSLASAVILKRWFNNGWD